TKAFAPSHAQGQLLVEWLPAHAHLWHHDIAIVVQKLFKAPPSRKLQGIKPRHFIARAEDRNSGLRIKRIRISAALSTWNWRIAEDVPLKFVYIGLLPQFPPPPLTADGEADAASRQVKEVGCVDGGI